MNGRTIPSRPNPGLCNQVERTTGTKKQPAAIMREGCSARCSSKHTWSRRPQKWHVLVQSLRSKTPAGR